MFYTRTFKNWTALVCEVRNSEMVPIIKIYDHGLKVGSHGDIIESKQIISHLIQHIGYETTKY